MDEEMRGKTVPAGAYFTGAVGSTELRQLFPDTCKSRA